MPLESLRCSATAASKAFTTFYGEGHNQLFPEGDQFPHEAWQCFMFGLYSRGKANNLVVAPRVSMRAAVGLDRVV